MEVISILDAAVLLYLNRQGEGTVPDMVAYLEGRGIETTANYLALQVRRLDSRGLVKQMGVRRRDPNRPGRSFSTSR